MNGSRPKNKHLADQEALKLKPGVWSECLCPPTPNSYVGILTSKGDGIRRCGPGDLEKLLSKERDLMSGVSAS